MTGRQKMIFMALILGAAVIIAAPGFFHARSKAGAGGPCSDFLVPSPDSKPRFVFFRLDNCPTCGQMERALKPVIEKYEDYIRFTDCNLKETKFTREEIDRMGMDGGAPHGVVFDSQGQVFRIYRGFDGQRMIDQIVADVEYVMGVRSTPKPLPTTEGTEEVVDEGP